MTKRQKKMRLHAMRVAGRSATVQARNAIAYQNQSRFEGLTTDQLRKVAAQKNVVGRSKMRRAELIEALL